MSIQQLRNCNFGPSKANATGSLGVGYQVLDSAGTVTVSRTTTGVYQTAPGIYAAYITFPDNFRGQVLWDTGSVFLNKLYATEQFNFEENNPNVDTILSLTTQISGTTAQLYDIQYGRWKIINNQMIFYKEDNSTEVVRFDLFDDTGSPTMDAVFDRVKV